jgi:FkbM family methyltransferase
MQHTSRFFLGAVPFFMRDWIRRIPVLAQIQRFIVSTLLDGSEFDHLVDAGPAKGITFHVTMPEDKGIWTGTYEIELATQLAAAVKHGVVAYDIGSWHGFFAGVMAAQGAREVHVFEPLPANVERIRQLISLNPDHAIKLHACAVGQGDAEMELIIMPETSMAKLEVSTFQAAENSTARVLVRVRAIDEMIVSEEISPPGIMKIDVEGAEAMVLEGALRTIRSHRPIIFAEIHSSLLLAQCRLLLERQGYAIEMIGNEPDGEHGRDIYQIRAMPGLTS